MDFIRVTKSPVNGAACIAGETVTVTILGAVKESVILTTSTKSTPCVGGFVSVQTTVAPINSISSALLVPSKVKVVVVAPALAFKSTLL